MFDDDPDSGFRLPAVFTHCNVCGVRLRTPAEDGMGMCGRCAGETPEDALDVAPCEPGCECSDCRRGAPRTHGELLLANARLRQALGHIEDALDSAARRYRATGGVHHLEDACDQQAEAARMARQEGER